MRKMFISCTLTSLYKLSLQQTPHVSQQWGNKPTIYCRQWRISCFFGGFEEQDVLGLSQGEESLCHFGNEVNLDLDWLNELKER